MPAEMRGPLFDGRADREAAAMCVQIERTVADEGEALVRNRLGQVLQHPSGYYESRITSEPQGDAEVITDGGVVYGPWLEGIGSRNYPDTRFKGYSTFRRVAQMLQARAAFTANKVAKPFVGRMG